jgi:flagellar motor switch protein FliM
MIICCKKYTKITQQRLKMKNYKNSLKSIRKINSEMKRNFKISFNSTSKINFKICIKLRECKKSKKITIWS